MVIWPTTWRDLLVKIMTGYIWDLISQQQYKLRLSARLKHSSAPTAVCGRRHLYRSVDKNAPWPQEFLGCWPAAVEQFTSGVASAKCPDRTVQTASEDVFVW